MWFCPWRTRRWIGWRRGHAAREATDRTPYDRSYRHHDLGGGDYRLTRMLIKLTVTDESRDWTTYHEVPADDVDGALALLYPAEYSEYEADRADFDDPAMMDDFATWLHNGYEIKAVEVDG